MMNATDFRITHYARYAGLNTKQFSFSLDTLLVTGLACYVGYRVWAYFNGLKLLNNLPGLRTIVEPLSPLGGTLPVFRWNPGLNMQWDMRLKLYDQFQRDTISIIPTLWGGEKIWTRNIDVARVVANTGPQSVWIKPIEWSQSLLEYGMSLLAAEGGDVWRGHRRIMSPAFNNRTFESVWTETIRIYRSMVDCEGWLEKETIEIPVINKYTYKLALFVISACGFGMPLQWDEPPQNENGDLSIQEALHTISLQTLTRIITPRFMYYLPIRSLRYLEKAHRTLGSFMKKQIEARKADLAGNERGLGSRIDVFSRLVQANADESQKFKLTDQELIGNTFVLMFAGHDTTGSSLAATLAFLSINQEEQELVYQDILRVIGHDKYPDYDNFDALYKVLAAFYEALRLFPAGSLMIRQCTEDTVLLLPDDDEDGRLRKLALKKGTHVMADMLGIQYNPKYFPDPTAYKPARWYADDGSGIKDFDAFTAFSFGPRACIGRKFAMTEAVCWLTLFLRDWKVEPIKLPGETNAQWWERVMQAQLIMTLTLKDVPLKLTRRRSP